MHLRQDTLLQGGKYRIVRFISSGGFGCTYEAEHVMLGERVAIKEFFVKDFCNRDEATAHVTIGTQSKRGLVDKLKRKFIEEAKMLYRMQHQGIVHVFDIFEENSTAYFVMDYIDGPSLSEVVAKEGALSEERAVRYIRQVAEALKYVHDHDRLHLDIKPGNIMIDSSDNAILIDFGASKQYDEVDGENTSTLLGKTPGYAPLEQMGNDVVKFLPATDIYALGATLYKLVTGITPLSANLLASGEELEPLPNSISAATRKAIDEAMHINKNKRTQSVAEFLILLGGEKTDSKLSQSFNVQTQPTSEESTKLTKEEETLVIGDTRENTQLDNEKKETSREPSATLVESKTWKELFKERHPIVNVMMVVMSFITLHSLLLASFFDYNTIGGALYIGVSCLIVIIGLWLLLKHKQCGLLFTALSVSIMSILSLSYFMGTYNYFGSSYLVDFFYYLFNFAIYPVVVLLAYYGILQIKRNGKSAWSLMKPAPSWMKKCVWAVWIILFIAIFGTKRWAQNYEIEQQTKMRIEQQHREKAVQEAEEKIRQQREQEKQKEKEKTTTSFYVTTSPAGAFVYVDGQYIGTTPIEGTEITCGSHQIKLSEVGYEDKTFTRTFGDKPVVLNVTLTEKSKPQAQVQSQNPVSSSSFSTPTTGKINGHEYVDLGLSVKWATCNVGASSPSDYGNYYAWGETGTKSEYRDSNCKTYGKSIGSIAGNGFYDAAHANWGGTWRLPTQAEFQELIDKCSWAWTSQGGHNGYKVTGKNGKSIFLPAAGWRHGTSLDYAGEYGRYWSATTGESDTQSAYGLAFLCGSRGVNWGRRGNARSVRPVSD